MVWDSFTITLTVVGVLTWLVFVLGMGKFSKFYGKFVRFSKDQDTNLTGLGSVIKKMQNTLSEMVTEQRRANKLMLELIELNRGGAPVELAISEAQSLGQIPQEPPAAEPEPAVSVNASAPLVDANSYLSRFSANAKQIMDKSVPASGFVPPGVKAEHSIPHPQSPQPAQSTPAPENRIIQNHPALPGSNSGLVQYFDPETQQIYHAPPEQKVEKVQIFDPETQEVYEVERPVSR